MCEGQGVYPPTHIIWLRNACSSQRGRIWVYMTCMHKEQYCIAWATPRLVWVCCYSQDLNATCKCHEEGPMGGNWNVCNFWRNKNFYLGKWELLGCTGGVAHGRDDILGTESFNSWCGGSMQIWIYHILSTWKWCGEDHTLRFGTGKFICNNKISHIL